MAGPASEPGTGCPSGSSGQGEPLWLGPLGESPLCLPVAHGPQEQAVDGLWPGRVPMRHCAQPPPSPVPPAHGTGWLGSQLYL